MVDYIKGRLVHKGADELVIDCGGIGLRILTSVSTLAEIGEIGTDAVCFTDLIVREDAMLLVGFSRREELDLYRMLTSVGGVGTRVALGILSSMSTRDLVGAIVNKDIKTLQTAKGVGKKTAELIVVALNDKLGRMAMTDPNGFGRDESDAAAGLDAADGAGVDRDALAALMTLGYTRVEAMRALDAFEHEGWQLDDVIKAALKRLMRF